MRSRAAFLPVPGDAFLLLYWFDLYQKVWRDEVDKLYIYFNSPVDKEVVDFVRDYVTKDPKVDWQYLNHQSDHGPALDRMLDICTEDHIVLMEDDCFTYKKGFIDEQFKKVESGQFDAVGSQRGCSTVELLQAAEAKYGDRCHYNGHDDSGVGFWPTMFFCKKNDLLKTDRNFSGKVWREGELIEPLNLKVSELTPSDTMVWLSIQLYELGLTFDYINSCHGRAEDIDHASDGQNIFGGKCSYVHIGSLSSGLSGFLIDNDGKLLSDGQPATYQNYGITEQEKGELERRLQWWKHCFDYVIDNLEVALPPDFVERYAQGLLNCVDHYKISTKRIDERIRVYNNLMGGF